MALSELDRAILDLEGSWWTVRVAKADQIRGRLAMSPTAFYRRLQELADDPDALDAAPLVVHRLRRRRDDRVRERLGQRGARA